MRISDWSSDVCSSDLRSHAHHRRSRACRCLPRRRGGAVPPSRHAARRALGGSVARFGQYGQRTHDRSEEHTSELQSLMRISYAVFGLQEKRSTKKITKCTHQVTTTSMY